MAGITKLFRSSREEEGGLSTDYMHVGHPPDMREMVPVRQRGGGEPVQTERDAEYEEMVHRLRKRICTEEIDVTFDFRPSNTETFPDIYKQCIGDLLSKHGGRLVVLLEMVVVGCSGTPLKSYTLLVGDGSPEHTYMEVIMPTSGSSLYTRSQDDSEADAEHGNSSRGRQLQRDRVVGDKPRSRSRSRKRRKALYPMPILSEVCFRNAEFVSYIYPELSKGTARSEFTIPEFLSDKGSHTLKLAESVKLVEEGEKDLDRGDRAFTARHKKEEDKKKRKKKNGRKSPDEQGSGIRTEDLLGMEDVGREKHESADSGEAVSEKSKEELFADDVIREACEFLEAHDSEEDRYSKINKQLWTDIVSKSKDMSEEEMEYKRKHFVSSVRSVVRKESTFLDAFRTTYPDIQDVEEADCESMGVMTNLNVSGDYQSVYVRKRSGIARFIQKQEEDEVVEELGSVITVFPCPDDWLEIPAATFKTILGTIPPVFLSHIYVTLNPPFQNNWNQKRIQNQKYGNFDPNTPVRITVTLRVVYMHCSYRDVDTWTSLWTSIGGASSSTRRTDM